MPMNTESYFIRTTLLNENLGQFLDTEFSELIPTVQGVGVVELIRTYDELTPIQIQPKPTNFLLNVDMLKEKGAFHETASFSQNFQTILRVDGNAVKTSDVIELVSGRDIKSLGYITSSSLKPLDTPYRELSQSYSMMVSLYEDSRSLVLENKSLLIEKRTLETNNGTLRTTISSMTSPPAYRGFQVYPDVWNVIEPAWVVLSGASGNELVYSFQMNTSMSFAVTGGVVYPELTTGGLTLDIPAETRQQFTIVQDESDFRVFHLTANPSMSFGNYYFTIKDSAVPPSTDTIGVIVQPVSGERPVWWPQEFWYMWYTQVTI